jgi:hypothetical protein
MERKFENTTDSPVTFVIAFGTMLVISFGLMLFAGEQSTQVASETTVPQTEDTAPAMRQLVEPEK